MVEELKMCTEKPFECFPIMNYIMYSLKRPFRSEITHSYL